MGVTIHYRFGQKKKFVPKMLDEAQAYAETLAKEQAPKVNVSFGIERAHPYRLTIMIGGCEWLCLGFGSMKHWEEKAAGKWAYENNVLREEVHTSLLNDPDMMFCAAFCKTQYAESIVEHKWVADILRLVASRCRFAWVYDEGDYYHTNRLEDAAEAIGMNGQMIAELGKTLREAFGTDNVEMGGETKITPRKRKQS